MNLAIDESDKFSLHWSGQSRTDGWLQLKSQLLHTPGRGVVGVIGGWFFQPECKAIWFHLLWLKFRG